MPKLNLQKLRENQEATWFYVDLIMLGLLMINLIWLSFDWLFTIDMVSSTLENLTPAFHKYYGEQIHPNYLRYDLVFVSIFIAELLVRWINAIRHQRYTRWYWYPFIHWYEVLGCIPLTGFRLLRLLRIISMVYRLQRLGIINLRETRLGRFTEDNYNVLMEHVADRVVINVLDGITDEVQHGQPVMRDLIQRVILPRKQDIAKALAEPITRGLEVQLNRHDEDVRAYLLHRIREAMEASEDIGKLEKVPLVGDYTLDLLERTISDIVYNILKQTADDLVHIDNQQLVETVVEALMELLMQETSGLDQVAEDILVESLEMIKERVSENKALERVRAR
ncbi:hypothetical protein FHR99_000979 [Litorivivens lipolytica]|uniref:Ion transporter n=1 Tax=Litorivivens lipolytica TaxID=1524264 RepID=A0A7W4Z520_9GAMM|nr:ion transporter [Litorivivens lipolytica]MBB3046743.1 hypothetical protein [Litorivivens lipolytica]